ncbi:hypothetical protein V492_07252 [Pseudogymnoascus sp. VKM F-4246]|nr:hypothetical protein V492_07252 [Pseudogymnoascus sp. VKM F-4246]
MKFSSSVAAAAALTGASAHTIMTNLVSNGVVNGVGVGIRVPSYDGPITDVSTSDIACNGGPNPTTPSNVVIDVKAGSNVQTYWRHTLTSTSSDVIDSSHKGPVMAYMKKVSDATTDTGIGGGWFKISQEGYDSSTGLWAVDKLIASGGVQTIPIPSCIANGQYLLRGEIIALHSASSKNGAQFYMECAQINVTGGTGSVTPATVSLPGAYKSTDPGILFNLYVSPISYTIPGPSVFSCSGGGSNTQPPTNPTTTAPPTQQTSTTAPPTQQTSTTPPTSGTGAPLYGQCGGTGWTGATTCASGTCKATNEWIYKLELKERYGDKHREETDCESEIKIAQAAAKFSLGMVHEELIKNYASYEYSS